MWGIVYLCSGHTTTFCQIDKQLHTFFFNKITIEELDGNYNLNVQPIQTIVAMKKILSVFCIATLLFASCSDEYEDSKLWQNVNDLKDRIASLEKTVQTMNSDIGSIQSIVDAINARVTCTYPAYADGWTVSARPDGTLTDEDGQTYRYDIQVRVDSRSYFGRVRAYCHWSIEKSHNESRNERQRLFSGAHHIIEISAQIV